MILFDDNYEKIYKLMMEENEQVHYYMQKFSKKLKKKYTEHPELPIWHYELVTLPKSNNTYLIYYYSMTYKEIIHDSYYCGSVLLLNGNDGQRLAVGLRKMSMKGEAMPDDVKYLVFSLQIFTGHFLSRYRERMKFPDSMSTYDVIASFFGRCGGYFSELPYDDIVLKKNRSKGNSAWGVDDGVTLATKTILNVDNYPVMVVKHNTFLAREFLKANQEKNTPTQEEMRMQCMHHFK